MAINYEEIMSLEEKNLELSYSQRDSIIYSLGIGLGKDPMDTNELKYVYENGFDFILKTTGSSVALSLYCSIVIVRIAVCYYCCDCDYCCVLLLL